MGYESLKTYLPLYVRHLILTHSMLFIFNSSPFKEETRALKVFFSLKLASKIGHALTHRRQEIHIPKD